MDEGIYLVKDNVLVAMTRQPYAGEDLLQVLLADHPRLLSGGHDSARRLMLIQREAGIPDQEGGSGRWSLDHLYLDQDAVPTLVEVKRSSDTRIRREVVGQMLDYAANAVVYWNPDELSSRFEATCQIAGVSPSERLCEQIGSNGDEEAFWQQAKANLVAGRIRMVFVSDLIPAELKRIVEFLNEQMSPAEVIAIEVQQYLGEGLTALVPRVLGNTSRAVQTKAVRSTGTPWDEERFFADVEQRRDRKSAEIMKRLFSWSQTSGLNVKWGAGKQTGSIYLTKTSDGEQWRRFNMWSDGSVNVYVPTEFEQMQSESRDNLVAQIQSLPGKVPGSVVADSEFKVWPNRMADVEDANLLIKVFEHLWSFEVVGTGASPSTV